MRRFLALLLVVMLPGLAAAQFLSPGERARPGHFGKVAIGQGGHLTPTADTGRLAVSNDVSNTACTAASVPLPCCTAAAEGTCGSIDLDETVRVAPTSVSIGNAAHSLMTMVPNGLTFDASGGQGSVTGLLVGGTWTVNQNTSSGQSAAVFRLNATLQNVSGTARRIGPAYGLFCDPTINLNAANVTGDPSVLGLVFDPKYTQTTSGTGAPSGVYAVQAHMTLNTGWTVAEFAGLTMLDATKTGGTLTAQAAVNILDLTAATTNLSLFSAGAAVTMRHAGSAIFGGTQTGLGSSTAPSARLHVSEPTAAAEVLRLEAAPTTTTQKPKTQVFEVSGQSSGTTATVVNVFTTASDTAYSMEFSCVGRCVSGAGCTAGQMVAGSRVGYFKNVGGTLSTITANPNGAEPIRSGGDLTGASSTLTQCVVTYCGAPICNAITPAACTGTTVSIQVKGVAVNQTVNWSCRALVQDMAS